MPERVSYPPCPVGVACTGCRYCELAKLAAEAAAVPRRIQRRRTAGWRMPAGAVYVGRPSKWGNPFRVGSTNWVPIDVDGRWSKEPHPPLTVEQAVECFRLISRYDLASYGPDYFAELAGRDLACWCPLEAPCHADVLLELANGPAS